MPGVLARVQSCLPATDPQRIELEKLPTADPKTKRAKLVRALERGFAASDEAHANIRRFRNVVLCSAVLIALVTFLLVHEVGQHPTAVPLCFQTRHHRRPGRIPACQPAAGSSRTVCPSGEQDRGGSPAVALRVRHMDRRRSRAARRWALLRSIRAEDGPHCRPVRRAARTRPAQAADGRAHGGRRDHSARGRVRARIERAGYPAANTCLLAHLRIRPAARHPIPRRSRHYTARRSAEQTHTTGADQITSEHHHGSAATARIGHVRSAI